MIKIKKESENRIIAAIAIPIVIASLIWFQLEISSGYSNAASVFHMNVRYILLNIATNLAIMMILSIVVKQGISYFLCSTVCFLLAEINHYTIKLHGMPLSIMDVKNARTAFNVIGAYTITLDSYAVCILIVFILNCVLCIAAIRIEKAKSQKSSIKIAFLKKAVFFFAGSMVFYLGYFSDNPVKPKKTIGWSWEEAYHQYGYLACSIEMIARTRHVVDMPEGYSDEQVKNIEITAEGNKNNQKPDIILILNETFYDLSQIVDLETDIPFMENINTMENTITGHAVVPYDGGGTNCSEYELLTSNSLQLMKGITPFNVLDMTNANSIVSHLNQLGYETTGAHSEPALNYSRGRAYRDMGFDKIYFDDDFQNKDYYEKRWFETDESLYKNLISWYESDSDAEAKFMYLLTIQNHGGWDMNPPEADTVHALGNFGEYQEQVNEYLSCVRLSDIAFKNLTEYFKTVDRPVIVCMVGDHSPTFASAIVDSKYSKEERDRRLQSTPFVIWANFNIESMKTGYLSMNYLVPYILETAEVKTSPYYDYMNALRRDIPVLTCHDIYMDKNGIKYSYQDITEYTDAVNEYFYLEYNSLQKHRENELFASYN